MFSPVSVIFVERRFGLHTQSVLVVSRAQSILAQRAIAYCVHVAQSNVAQVLRRRCHVPQRASSPVGCRLRLAWKPFRIQPTLPTLPPFARFRPPSRIVTFGIAPAISFVLCSRFRLWASGPDLRSHFGRSVAILAHGVSGRLRLQGGDLVRCLGFFSSATLALCLPLGLRVTAISLVHVRRRRKPRGWRRFFLL